MFPSWVGPPLTFSDLVKELKTLEPALLASPTTSALVSVSPQFTTPLAWRIDAVGRDIPLISNYADKQWYQAELNALQTGDTSLSPMLHQTAPQKSYIRTRTTVVNGVGHVIAYNYGSTAVSGVTFTWASLPTTAVPVVGENRTLTPTGSTFKDNFAAYEAHVYKVQ